MRALKDSEKTNKKKTKMPRAKRNCWIVSIPKILELLKIVLIIIFDWTSSGFERTAMKGSIEATPIVSNKAIIKIIIKSKIALLRSWGVSKYQIFIPLNFSINYDKGVLCYKYYNYLQFYHILLSNF